MRVICEDEDQANTTYGPELARSLQRRLADMRAVKSVTDLSALPGKFRRMTDLPFSDCGVEIGEGYWVVFTSGHPRRPERDGDIDWPRVTRIKILKIEKING